MIRPAPLLPALLLLAPAALPAQSPGGIWQLLRDDPGTAGGELAGESVAWAGDVDGDGADDLLVGMPGASPNGLAGAGSARLLSGADGSELLRLDGEIAGGAAGLSVAGGHDLDGDGVPDLLVGSPFATINGDPDTGRVDCYSGATGALIHRFDGPLRLGKWGVSVTFLDDISGDGVSEVFAGAFQAPVGGVYDAGLALVLDGVTGAELFRVVGAGIHVELGFAVASAGDVNGDGLTDFMVGAPTDNTPIHHAGKIFVHSGADGSLIHELHGDWDSGHMGAALASAGDVDGDGVPDILGGAPTAFANGRSQAGVVRLWSGADGSLMAQFAGSHAGQLLGESLAPAGDLNQDGYADFAIGAPQTDVGGANRTGSLFLHSGIDGALIRREDGAAAGEEFASRVAFGGDSDSDGLPEFLVGVPGRDQPSGSDAGSASLIAYRPWLSFGPSRLSAAAAGTLAWQIDFPASEAGLGYAVLLSASGTGPSNFLGLDLPLSQDSIFTDATNGNFPAGFLSPIGTLDGNGDGAASYTAPAGALAGLVGRRFWSAAVSFVPGVAPSLSSGSAMVEVAP